MRPKMFSEFNPSRFLLPKLQVPIRAPGDEEVGRRDGDVGDDVPMHITLLVHGGGGEGVEEGLFELERALLPLLRRRGARPDHLIPLLRRHGGGGNRAIAVLPLALVLTTAVDRHARYGGVCRGLARRRHRDLDLR
uniref:Uncharacterized protein n=1 Tax=Arundo donax TaxID=35708 RepID=A0A0A9BPW3_ARUDO